MVPDQTEQGVESPPQRFVLPVRIYYEDTDAGGIVYHASYLRFMERARTDFLRYLGYERTRLMTEFQVQFVVSEMTIKYLKPAFLDDMVDITLSIKQPPGYARAIFHQTVERGGELIAAAVVSAVCVELASLKPVSFPKPLREKMKGLM
ncbi:MAG: tol-pal system-associated acyl-CoA thioesterase [Pseudomonadota bacterium]